MSKNAEVPNAWDDDWESQADVGDNPDLCHMEESIISLPVTCFPRLRC